MNGFDKIKSQVNELEDEFYSISSLYNLHIIEIKNAYNNALLSAYSEKLNEEFTLATLSSYNQVLFYNTDTKNSKTINLSLNMFSESWKIFIKDIEELAIQSSSKEFHSSFKEKSFNKANIVKTSRALIYYRLDKFHGLHGKNILFTYKPKSLQEREFLIKNDSAWLYITEKLSNKMKANADKISKLKQPVLFSTDPFNKKFTYSIVSDITNKIRKKSLSKIDIKIKNIDENERIVILNCDMFLPLAFVKYIQNYITSNTMYRMHFAN